MRAGAAWPGRVHHQPGAPCLSSPVIPQCPWRHLLLLPWRLAQNLAGFFSRPGSVGRSLLGDDPEKHGAVLRTRRGDAAGSGARTCLVPGKRLSPAADSPAGARGPGQGRIQASSSPSSRELRFTGLGSLCKLPAPARMEMHRCCTDVFASPRNVSSDNARDDGPTSVRQKASPGAQHPGTLGPPVSHQER